MTTTQATYWYAQLTDGTKMRGGQSDLFNTDVNVSTVPVSAVKAFSIVANWGADTYYVPWKQWYHDGVAWSGDYPYPDEYTLGDGSVITVDLDFSTGLLKLSQTAPTS